MIRVAFGWIGGAGRHPAARSACRSGAIRVERPVELDLGIDPEVEIRPGERGSSRADRSVKAPDRLGRPGCATGPRGAYAKPTASGEGGARGSGRRSGDRPNRPRRTAIGHDAVRRPAVHRLDRGPARELEVGAGIARLDEASQRRRDRSGGRHDRSGRRSRSTMTSTIDAQFRDPQHDARPTRSERRRPPMWPRRRASSTVARIRIDRAPIERRAYRTRRAARRRSRPATWSATPRVRQPKPGDARRAG